jgi:hypothetical protein
MTALNSRKPGPAEARRPAHIADQKCSDIPPMWAWSTAYPAAGRRHRWLLFVAKCPYACGGGRVRYGNGPTGGIRRSGCDRGQYNLRTRPPLAVAR